VANFVPHPLKTGLGDGRNSKTVAKKSGIGECKRSKVGVAWLPFGSVLLQVQFPTGLQVPWGTSERLSQSQVNYQA